MKFNFVQRRDVKNPSLLPENLEPEKKPTHKLIDLIAPVHFIRKALNIALREYGHTGWKRQVRRMPSHDSYCMTVEKTVGRKVHQFNAYITDAELFNAACKEAYIAARVSKFVLDAEEKFWNVSSGAGGSRSGASGTGTGTLSPAGEATANRPADGAPEGSGGIGGLAGTVACLSDNGEALLTTESKGLSGLSTLCEVVYTRAYTKGDVRVGDLVVWNEDGSVSTLNV